MHLKAKTLTAACVTALCIGGMGSAVAQDVPPANGPQLDWLTSQPSGPATGTVDVADGKGNLSLTAPLKLSVDPDKLGDYTGEYTGTGRWTTLYLKDGTEVSGTVVSSDVQGAVDEGGEFSFTATYSDVPLPDGGEANGAYTGAEPKAFCVGLGLQLNMADGTAPFDRKQFCWKFDKAFTGAVADGSGQLTLDSALTPTGLNGVDEGGEDPDGGTPTEPSTPSTTTPSTTTPSTTTPSTTTPSTTKPSTTTSTKPISTTSSTKPSSTTSSTKPSSTTSSTKPISTTSKGTALPSNASRQTVRSVPSGTVL